MYFHYFVIISPWKRVGPVIWTNLNPLHPRMLCANFGWIGSVVLEKKIFKFLQCIFTISKLSPLGKGGALHLNKLEYPSPKDALCPSLVENGSVVLDKTILKFHQCIFTISELSSLGKGRGPSTNLNPLHPRMLWLKLAQWFWRKIFF